MNEFIKKVNEMRQAQKEYFATRKQSALIHSKELEKEVDRMLQTDLNQPLKQAVQIIRTWHGEPAWNIYYSKAPEMKIIREQLD